MLRIFDETESYHPLVSASLIETSREEYINKKIKPLNYL